MPILIIFIYWSHFFGWSEDLHKLNCLVIARTRAMAPMGIKSLVHTCDETERSMNVYV